MWIIAMPTAIRFALLPRNPLLRTLVLVVGAALLVGLVVMSLLLGAAVIAIAACVLLVRRWFGRRARRRADPGIIEGEFTVVPRMRARLPHTD